MDKIQHNISLKNYNTFGIDVKARSFIEINTVAALQELTTSEEMSNHFLLGGGSNMLLTKDIDALVVHLNIKGKKIIDEDDNHVWIKANAGENWHDFVLWCIDQDFGGLENMSLIPGNVGTAPIQNIGAYGVELKDSFIECEVVEIESGLVKLFDHASCQFDYRNSIFKSELKGKIVITSVTFKLTKKNHTLNTSYGAIESELSNMGIDSPTIKDISDVVITIRQSKLPDPNTLGNSGSFFKNPVISKEAFDLFIAKHPEAPNYKVSNTEVKIPAGWLIEQVGFKGKRFGDAGVHNKQALVLVNHGHAKGEEIWQLAMKIKAAVKEQFDIDITPEVNIY
ncbi:MAG: UDP-N-acetylmuramate dehydrogenase [Flavobacteriaceae bacterium]|nr:UDP-N-acetylmuramate dehydrogenase [Flavobacteriaceae bacterium]